eukprot:9508959-Heterocapsa_arctica.AAC.1
MKVRCSRIERCATCARCSRRCSATRPCARGDLGPMACAFGTGRFRAAPAVDMDVWGPHVNWLERK